MAETSANSPEKIPAEAVKPAGETAELQETKVKQAFLEKFKFKKKKDTQAETASETPPDTNRQTAEALYKELAEIKSADHWTIRIRKKTLVTILGVGILFMWLIILSQVYITKFKPEWAFWAPAEPTSIQTSPTSTPPAEKLVRIRVRDNYPDPQLAAQISQLLSDAGYQLEVVDDHESDYVGIMLITKKTEAELKQALETILNQKYTLGSPSAELTEDSDFGAVILVGDLAPTPHIASDSARR